MMAVVLWGLLLLLGQHTQVNSHVLGRPFSASDSSQLKSLLERLEETISEADQEQNPELDQEVEYDIRDQDPGQRWNLDLGRDQDQVTATRSEIHSRPSVQRSHLQDLLMSLRKRASSCFGARMDRIGNASGLGCNNGRG
ncbi:natriuretic peptides A [Takifugu flavidus]|nr:natriuretic peptides A [Takifugu flavidus]